MKTLILLLLITIPITSRILSTKEQDEAQIQNLKKEEESFKKDKPLITSWLRFWKDEVKEEDSENTNNLQKLQIEEKNTKGENIVTKMDIKTNLDRNLVDFDYKFMNCKNSLEIFEKHLSPIIDLEKYYSIYFDKNGNSKNVLATKLGEEFNLKMYKEISQLNRNEDELKKGVTILTSTSDFIKSPSFSMSDFFLPEKTYLKPVEKKILQNDEAQLSSYFTQFLNEREKMVTNISELEFLNNTINTEFSNIYEIVNGMLGEYKQKIADLDMINKIGNNSLRDINELFRLRIKILDQKNLISGIIEQIEKQRDEIDKILGKAQFIVNDLKSQNFDNSNIEQIMKKDQEKIDTYEKENDIVDKIKTGELEVKDIKSPELGQEVIEKLKDEGNVVVKEGVGLDRVLAVLVVLIVL